mmetsp:Transcript_2494/g.7505  ORF Transcript_2494/g.7505 Transcript_2494/m.7505 type:complete len:164 (-) Transcript_2494:635-1126(-)|eukprot:CAMPEP_0206146702 /NCGR_PEP_ID=MMETSP1473-20131121/31151_1 /ASSEMBLY_ACC=CAM_ASM_001109 /TAXON_ID=1461547 /ORGANISM="Stichococcus sp, Strain RCC1054" /LENGTH=163 /DNA_ID=CAMNT_0053543355 /DNA_START=59 /DNA_END=550 /DNA_ORIENTATION=-
MASRSFLIAAICVLAAIACAEAGIPNGRVQREIVARHNKMRARYGAPKLTWSGTIAKTAYSFTQRCSFGHDTGTLLALRYGENLTAGTRNWATSINLWLNEAPLYNFKNPGFSPSTGHFTQVVWKGTKKVGCAMSWCNNSPIWSCRYSPPGNYGGQFPQQVGK